MNLLDELRKVAADANPLEEDEAELGEDLKEHIVGGDLPLKVLEFFHENPNPSDEEFHEWAEDNDMDPDDAEEIAYQFVTEFANFIFGGKSQGMAPEGIDADQLSKGIVVELEHTPNRLVAAKIALDHLVESPIYYDALAKMEASLEGGATES